MKNYFKLLRFTLPSDLSTSTSQYLELIIVKMEISVREMLREKVMLIAANVKKGCLS